MDIIFTGDLTADHVLDLKPKLQEGLDNHSGITLRFRGMTACDSLGIQILVSAGKSAEAMNQSLVLSGTLAPVLDMINRLGLDHERYFTLEERSV